MGMMVKIYFDFYSKCFAYVAKSVPEGKVMDAWPSDAGHREINQVSNTKMSFNLSVFVFGDLQNIHFVDKKIKKHIWFKRGHHVVRV